MPNLNPNGTEGVFEPECWWEPGEKFTHKKLNTLAYNTEYFAQQYTPMLHATHRLKCTPKTSGSPVYEYSNIMQSYTYMEPGSYTIRGKITLQSGSGTQFTGRVYLDNVLHTSFNSGITFTKNITITGAPRWYLVSVTLTPNNVAQTLLLDYSIGYRGRF